MPRGAKPGQSHGPLQKAFRARAAAKAEAIERANGAESVAIVSPPADSVSPERQNAPPTHRNVLFQPFAEQEEFMRAALTGRYKFLLYGGAIRSGKTFVVLGIALLLAKLFPGIRIAVVRKTYGNLVRNVLPSWDKIRPRHFAPDINHSTMTCTCANGSQIIFVAESLTNDPDLERFRGFETNVIILEEAHELSRKMFDVAIERAGTWIVPGLEKQPPSLVLATCNPGQSWVKSTWYDPYISRSLVAPYFFKQALPDRNPYIPDSLREQWKSLPEHIYRRMVKGDWTVSDDPRQIVPYQQLHDRIVYERADIKTLEGAEALGVDYGGAAGDPMSGDESVFAHGRGSVLYECSGYRGLLQGTVATMVKTRMQERGINARNVGIDAVGEGSGVETALRLADIHVQRILAGAKPDEAAARIVSDKAMLIQFANLKAAMWWKLRADVTSPDSEFMIYMPADEAGRLVQDLTSVYYRETDARIIVEEKSETKRRIGRSPDYGDAAVIWNWVRGAEEVEFASGVSTGDSVSGVDSIYDGIGDLWGDSADDLDIYR